ncbi:NAD-dependent epimerase [Aerococcus urinaehominis]|uniref:NAD-dependent epimerase n=1 Tax=Aerococcus urinaehominis TaxID=128944 RepID=A0A0X8FMB9_9LACT|nr:NAD-dependent epimerase/dehydratase family protein [Aerococcus urinaehominis]AMB99867.1 NAD-dependent epimerase [Aerococcus urinaehominis]SDM54294.1 UDP-glucose 4-epimerase [Aerococcus urinaehominis]
MKKILITGEHSYIGDSFADWLAQWPENYQVTKWDFKGDDWQNKDFSQFDTVFNVAGIAHNSNDKNLEDLYYQVNRDLAVAIAKKAKAAGVGQYIHMSSIIVYGSQVEEITLETPFNPDNFYGDSKVQAEKELTPLADDQFKLALIRPPMIYGKGSKGNYPILAKFAKQTPVFPDIDNKRSMLHIDNLCELIRLIIDQEAEGIFYPQMPDYVKTSEMVKTIAEVLGKKLHLTKGFNPILKALAKQNLINKVFGSIYYQKEMSQHFGGAYQVNDLRESIEKTEG